MTSQPFNRTVLMFTMGAVCLAPVLASAGDLKEAAPPDVFLAVFAQHNPERDYQKQYYEEVWKTVEQTRIFERTIQIIQSRLNDGDAQQFLEVRDALKEAVSPIEWEKVVNSTQTLYAQRMQFPAAQHLLLMEIPDGGATGLHDGIANLFRMADEAAGPDITVVTEEIGGFSVTRMQLPGEVPFEPLVGVNGDVFLFSTSTRMAGEAAILMDNPSAESKFDDPRVAEALTHLPEAEDVLAFFDGKALAEQMGGLGDFVRNVSGGDPEAARIAGLMDEIFSQIEAFDSEITVEYTDGYQNRTAAFGRLAPGYQNTLIGQMFASQEPFENWSRWVPDDAKSFSLHTGVNLHALYVWVMDIVPRTFPEAQPAIDQFEMVQDQYDVHLDEDILQAFSGESVSLSFAGGAPTPFGQSGQSALWLRCHKPERIKELLHRAVDTMNTIPQVAAQGIGFKDVPGMEGFEEISANFMAMSGMKPVIGFKDGWMVMGSHAAAVQKVLLTKSGEAPSIVSTDTFTQFDLDVEGTVSTISYQNTAESTRQAAMALQQVGMMAPMFMGMAAQNNAGREEMAVVQEVLGLLPAVGQIVAKFDFIESKLSVTQAGPSDETYIRHGVTLIRPPADSSRSN